MPRDKGRSFNFIPLAAAFVVCLLGFLVFLLLRGRASFPALPTGAYSGFISGTSSRTATFYAERIRSSNAFLFVIFAEGWKPQIVFGELQPAAASSEERFYPLTIKNEQGREYVLRGSGKQDGFKGKVRSGKETLGSWSLERLPNEKLHDDFSRSFNMTQLKQWLEYKGRYYELARNDAEVERAIKDKHDKLAKLNNYVSEEQSLRERAKERRNQLRRRIKELRQTNQAKTDELNRAVGELEQLVRITRRGRAIELARRVAKRENKWYFVNWEKGQDLSSMEEQLAQESGIDSQKLETSVKRAQEVHALRAQIEQEKQRIYELQETYRERVNSDRENRRREQQFEERQEEKPWWNVFR